MQSASANGRSVVRLPNMGRLRGPYNAEFPPGSEVRIAERLVLEKFKSEWRLHNPLTENQLEFGGRSAIVREVGYYHET